MPHLIIWNTFNSQGDDHGTNPVPLVAARTAGPHQLAAWLSQHGYNIKVLDFCHLMTTSELVTLTEKFVDKNTIAIGCSSTFWKNFSEGEYEEPEWVIKGRTELQDRYPNLEWVLGGTEAFSGKLYRFRWRKFYSYSENMVLKYLDEKTEQKTVRIPFDIKTLTHHYKDGLGITPQEVLPMQMSRGCQFKCNFCRAALLGKRKGTYIRDYALIEKELLINFERYGTTRYYFIDDTMNESEEKVIALAEIASRLPFQLEWVGYNRLDLIASRPHTIELLRASGLRGAFFGMESFNPESARAVSKGWIGKHAKDFLLELKSIWKNDVTWTLSFIVGLPGETMQSLNETQRWLIDNQMYSWMWNALYISCDPAIPDKSQFEKDYAKSGYSFPNPNFLTHWVSDNWNFNSSFDTAVELTKQKLQYERVTTWRLAEYATSLNVSFASLMDKYTKDIDNTQVALGTKEQVKRYIEYQFAQP